MLEILKELIAIFSALNQDVWAFAFAILGVIVALASIHHPEIFPAATSLLGMAALAFKGQKGGQ